MQHLQRALGVEADGDLGPKTLAAVANADPVALINAIRASRLRFLQGLKTWGTFGKGWMRRVDEVRDMSLKMAGTPQPSKVTPVLTPKVEHKKIEPGMTQNPNQPKHWLTPILNVLANIADYFGGKK